MFDRKGGEQNGYMVLGTGICQGIFCLCDDSVCVAVCGIPGLLKRQKPYGAVCFLCDGSGCAAQYGGTKSGRVSYTVRMADCRAVLRHIAAWLAEMAPRAAGADQKDLPPVSGNLRHPAFAASPAQQSKRRDRACTCTIQAEHTGTALRLSDAGGGCVLWHGVFFLRGIP